MVYFLKNLSNDIPILRIPLKSLLILKVVIYSDFEVFIRNCS